MPRQKVRIRFRKGGDLRLLSHHDLMRCFERMLRRAALPFHSTEGYNPKPRMVFALSLALGIVGCREVVELELDEELPADEIGRRLGEQAPPGLEILSVHHITSKAAAQVVRLCYRVELPESCVSDDLPERVHALLAATSLPLERERPQQRLIDVRPFLRQLSLEGRVLEMDMWVTPRGAARPDEVLGLLGLSHILDEGAILERTTLELQDEQEEAAPAGRPAAPAVVAAAPIAEA